MKLKFKYLNTMAAIILWKQEKLVNLKQASHPKCELFGVFVDVTSFDLIWFDLKELLLWLAVIQNRQ